MMIKQDRSNWPDWLKAADTENAVVEIDANGRVSWHSGVWRNGEWRNGVWHGGTWHGGFDGPSRCTFKICGDDDFIKVGCRTFTLSDARALCDGGDLPDEAPARDSDAGRLLRAAVLAQIAWQEALREDD